MFLFSNTWFSHFLHNLFEIWQLISWDNLHLFSDFLVNILINFQMMWCILILKAVFCLWGISWLNCCGTASLKRSVSFYSLHCATSGIHKIFPILQLQSVANKKVVIWARNSIFGNLHFFNWKDIAVSIANALLLYKSSVLKPGKPESFQVVLFGSHRGYILSIVFLLLHFPCSFNWLCMHRNTPLSSPALPNMLCKCCKGFSYWSFRSVL